jgi:hypothetical protein
MFDDFISGITGLFGGGDSSGQQAPAAPAAPPASGIIAEKPRSTGGNLLQSLVLGVGPMVLSRLMGAGDQRNIDKATKSMLGNANIASKAGQALVDRASQGKLTDPQQAAVDKMKREHNAVMQQSFAKMGIPMSTMQAQAANQVDADAQEFANKLINESFQQGISALGLGTSASQALLASATQQKKDLAQTIGEVAKQIGMIMNTPEKKTPTGTQTQVPSEWGTWNPEEGIFASNPADPYAA